jgi:hypothetical protein
MMLEQVIGNFMAKYPDGTPTKVLIFQSTDAGGSLGTNRSYEPVIQRIATESGVALHRVSKGLYKMQDCELTSDDPNCP